MDFGTDFDLQMEGFAPGFPLTTGGRLVLGGVVRRWTTDQESTAGQRIYRGRCRDIRKLLAGRFDAARLQALGLELAEIAKDDERIEDCAAVLDGNSLGKVVRLRAQVLLVDGTKPLGLVLPFDTFTPELIPNG